MHTPLQASPSDISHFKEKAPLGKQANITYAAMVSELDRQTGRLLDALDTMDLSENTIVFFTSDNGGLGGYEDIDGNFSIGATHNAPLRGGKGMLTEGGIRVPLLVRWPEVISSGSLFEMPVSTLDFYPTFLSVAGVDVPDSLLLDGNDLLPFFSGESTSLDSGVFHVWHFPGYLERSSKKGTWRATPSAVLREGAWKIYEDFETGKVQLFNLHQDVGEMNDLSNQDEFKSIKSTLLSKLHQWRIETGALMPVLK